MRVVTIEETEDGEYLVTPPDYSIYDGDAHEASLEDAEAIAQEFATAYGCQIRYAIPGRTAEGR